MRCDVEMIVECSDADDFVNMDSLFEAFDFIFHPLLELIRVRRRKLRRLILESLPIFRGKQFQQSVSFLLSELGLMVLEVILQAAEANRQAIQNLWVFMIRAERKPRVSQSLQFAAGVFQERDLFPRRLLAFVDQSHKIFNFL